MIGIINSKDAWDDVLKAIGLDRDIDEPLQKLVVTLEVGRPVVVEQVKYASRKGGK